MSLLVAELVQGCITAPFITAPFITELTCVAEWSWVLARGSRSNCGTRLSVRVLPLPTVLLDRQWAARIIPGGPFHFDLCSLDHTNIEKTLPISTPASLPLYWHFCELATWREGFPLAAEERT